MKSIKGLFILIPVVYVLSFVFAGERKPLAELYKTGKVRFVQELVLDEKTMPKDVQFAGPGALDCDAAGNVYVMDFSDNNIKLFDPSGKFLKLIGRKGQGPGEFNMPIDIVFAKDRLVVWDMGNDRICTLTLNGGFIKAKNASAFAGRPYKVGALPTGEIVLDTEKTYFSEPDRPQDRFLEILTPDLQAVKKLYSQPVLRNKYMRSGAQLFNLPQPFCSDIYWDVSPSGNIVVGFSGKYEISIYNKEGAKVSIFSHSYDPVKVTAEDEKNFFGGMSYTTETGIKRGAPDHIVKNTTFPKFKPAFNALIVDSDGNTLIHTYRKNKDEMFRYFDAFDVQGKFIATVHVEGDVPFPSQSRISRIANGCFWLIQYGSDELPRVIKYRIAE
ncbi:MAG: 6-bladed beta-propeller [Candidatus Aminicenantales bacterium]